MLPESELPDIPPPALDHPEYRRHYRWMQQAIGLAGAAGAAGEVPVGALVVDAADPTAHAEVLALRAAGQSLESWRLEGCTLYVTLEPCPMCSGAIIQARLGLLVYGADDPKAGAIRTVLNLPDSLASNHRLAVLGGILEQPCRQQLQSWFAERRRHHKALQHD